MPWLLNTKQVTHFGISISTNTDEYQKVIYSHSAWKNGIDASLELTLSGLFLVSDKLENKIYKLVNKTNTSEATRSDSFVLYTELN